MMFKQSIDLGVSHHVWIRNEEINFVQDIATKQHTGKSDI